MPDLSEFYVDREDIEKQQNNEDVESGNGENESSENSGDSPRENLNNYNDKEEAENIEEEQSIPNVVISSTHRDDGIIYPLLTKPGYYTMPSMEELKRMSAKQLYQVKDFTVCHRLHGSVKWEGLSDVRSLNLDKIVFLEHGRIEVYPDDVMDKPQQSRSAMPSKKKRQYPFKNSLKYNIKTKRMRM